MMHNANNNNNYSFKFCHLILKIVVLKTNLDHLFPVFHGIHWGFCQQYLK